MGDVARHIKDSIFLSVTLEQAKVGYPFIVLVFVKVVLLVMNDHLK